MGAPSESLRHVRDPRPAEPVEPVETVETGAPAHELRAPPAQDELAGVLAEGGDLAFQDRPALGPLRCLVRQVAVHDRGLGRKGGEQCLRDRSVLRCQVDARRVTDCHVGGGSIEMGEDPNAIPGGLDHRIGDMPGRPTAERLRSPLQGI